MNSLKNITYSLLVIISFSLFSVSAQADGISVRIGGSGYGYNAGYNSNYPSAYFAYNSPIVTYRHYNKPYYPGYVYRNNVHLNRQSGFSSRRHSGQRDYYRSNNRYSNYSRQGFHGKPRIASHRSH